MRGIYAYILVITFAFVPTADAQNVPIEATDAAAESYASAERVSVDEAKIRLRIEDLAGPEIKALVSRYGNRVAGVYWQAQPNQHVAVRLTDVKPVKPAVLLTAAGAVPVLFVTCAKHNREERLGALNKYREYLSGVFDGYVGMGVDEMNGSISIELGVDDATFSAYQSAADEVSATVGVPISLVRRSQTPWKKLAYIVGGAGLGNNNTFCASGFAARHTASDTWGCITAAHCPDLMTYANYRTVESNNLIQFNAHMLAARNSA